MSSEELRKKRASIQKRIDAALTEAERGRGEAERVADVISHTPEILDDLDREFCERTQLDSQDVAIMFVAIGLQIARQYIVAELTKVQDNQTAAQNTLFHTEEHSNRSHRYYNPSLQEILTNPVPFDANIGANGALAGGKKMGHRVTAIGHDPLLGLIFGTANIATSTLTTSRLETYHIYTNEMQRDFFWKRANTATMFDKVGHKLLHENIEGKAKVALSLGKEMIHLQSDLYTENSLPLPVVSVINSEYAATLAERGLKMSNIMTFGQQMAYSTLINSLIAMYHMMFDSSITDGDKKLYEVKTRKILMYSNVVATSTNLMVAGVTGNMHLLDLGGFAVTVYRLITDKSFIRQVKEEFIFGGYRNLIMGDF